MLLSTLIMSLAGAMGLIALVLIIVVLCPAMASPVQGVKKQGHIQMGQNGRLVEWGTFQFTTTGATVALDLNMRNLESLLITPCGTPASDEIVSGPAIASGALQIGGTGQVTITRTGAVKTNNLVCSYLAFGW